jgi:hypothetical protein
VQEEVVDVFQILPDGADRTTATVTRYVPHRPDTEARRERFAKGFARLLAIIDDEDYVMCEQTQRSFRSGAQRELVFGRNEPGLTHYHRSIERMLRQGATGGPEAAVGLGAPAGT